MEKKMNLILGISMILTLAVGLNAQAMQKGTLAPEAIDISQISEIEDNYGSFQLDGNRVSLRSVYLESSELYFVVLSKAGNIGFNIGDAGLYARQSLGSDGGSVTFSGFQEKEVERDHCKLVREITPVTLKVSNEILTFEQSGPSTIQTDSGGLGCGDEEQG